MRDRVVSSSPTVYLQRALPSGPHPVRIGVLLAERLQVVGIRLAAAQRATRYLGGNRVLLYGLITYD